MKYSESSETQSDLHIAENKINVNYFWWKYGRNSKQFN